MHKEEIELNIIYEDGFLKIYTRQEISQGDSGAVLLSFTGIGHAMGGGCSETLVF